MNLIGLLNSLKSLPGKPRMSVVHALQPLRKSIFLAGPTPRSSEVQSWRPDAIERLRSLGFNGDVFVPEASNWAAHDNYDEQVWWELEAINQATVVVVWIPRDLDTMPAFTTNVEFGYLVRSGKALLGAPEDAPKMNYLRMLASKHNVSLFNSLDEILTAAIDKASRGGRG